MDLDGIVDRPNSVNSSRSRVQSPPPTPPRKRSLDSVMNDDATRDAEASGDGERVAKKTKRVPVDGDKLADDLALELQCGCCAGLCYNPVVVQPCQHFFCGSCCVLWVKNGGTNCPACRGVSTNVKTCRILASMLATLLRADPSRQRAVGERQQADEVYHPGVSIRIPVPKAPSPEPQVREPDNDMYARPCPHCTPNNQYNWRCPVPIIDPSVDRDHAFNLEDGIPEGHAFCGNCDLLHAFGAPTSSKCDFCLASFCGITVEDRCRSVRVIDQTPNSVGSIQDLLESGEIYDIFNSNTIEVDRLLDYMREEGVDIIGDVYPNIVNHLLRQPEPFRALYEAGIFALPPETTTNPPAPPAPANDSNSDSDSDSDPGSDDEGEPAPTPTAATTTTEDAATPIPSTSSSQPLPNGDAPQPHPTPAGDTTATDIPPQQPPNDASSPASPTSDGNRTRPNTPPPPPAAPPAPRAPVVPANRKKICRSCASEIFFWGLKEWWIRERERVLVKPAIATATANAEAVEAGSSGAGGEQTTPAAEGGEDAEKVVEPEPEVEQQPQGILAVLRRLTECEDGAECDKQMDMSHARAFSHIIPRARLQPPSGEDIGTSGTQNQDSAAIPPPTDAMEGIVVPPAAVPNQEPQVVAVAEPMDIDAVVPPAIPLSDVIVEGFLEGTGEGVVTSGAILAGVPPVATMVGEIDKQEGAAAAVVTVVAAASAA